MKTITIQELVKDLQGAVIEVESVDTYGINFSFQKARMEYNATLNELSFVAGRYDRPEGIGTCGINVDDIVECITLGEDGSYTIEFNQYMSDIVIRKVV